MVWPCDFLVGRKCCSFRVSHRVAWLGVVYFTALLAVSVLGAVVTDGATYYTEATEENSHYQTWFIFCSIFRLVDLFNSFFTAVRRRIRPQNRKTLVMFSAISRIASFFGEFALAITAIVLLSQQGGPQSLTKGPLLPSTAQIAFYVNFIIMAMFYGFILSPCGIAIIFAYCFCTESSRDDDEQRFDRRRAPPALAHDVQQRAAAQFGRPVENLGPAPQRQQPLPPGAWRNFIKSIGMADLMGSDDLECTFCLAEFDNIEPINQLPCGHCFHANCLLSYYLQNDSKKICPICRQPVDTATDLHNV